MAAAQKTALESADANGEATIAALKASAERTEFGRELMRLWEEVEAPGQPLLDGWDDLEREVAERR